MVDYETEQLIIHIYIKYTSEKNWKIKFRNSSERRVFDEKCVNSDVTALLGKIYQT